MFLRPDAEIPSFAAPYHFGGDYTIQATFCRQAMLSSFFHLASDSGLDRSPTVSESCGLGGLVGFAWSLDQALKTGLPRVSRLIVPIALSATTLCDEVIMNELHNQGRRFLWWWSNQFFNFVQQSDRLLEFCPKLGFRLDSILHVEVAQFQFANEVLCLFAHLLILDPG